MAQDNPNPAEPNRPDDRSRDRLDRMALERLARCAADGELSEADAREYESAKASHPELERLESSERSMRRAVGRCMGEVTCPSALRARVMGMLDREGMERPELQPETLLAGTGSSNGGSAGSEAGPLRFPVWKRALAMAAAVALLVVGVVYFQNGPGTVQADMPTGIQLAGYMSGEHHRCIGAPETLRKFTERDLERVPAAFRDVLGEQVSTEQLLLGDATFIAAGKCRVPGKGPSIHLLYEVFNSLGERVEVSLYVQRCKDDRFEPGKAYVIGDEGSSGGHVIGWRHGEVIYYLVTGTPELTRDMADKLNAPQLAGAF